MKQLIVVSTAFEILPFYKNFGFSLEIPSYSVIELRKNLSLLISGVGAPSTIYCLTKALREKNFDRVIQVGVAGSYSREIDLGSLTEVRSDCFADLGVDDNGQFQSLYDSSLAELNDGHFENGRIINRDIGITGFPLVDSITVNTVSGSKHIIDQRISGFNPDIETMEGASSFYVCKMEEINVLQVRAISNYVEPRNREAWKLNLAIDNLNNWLAEFVIIGEGK